MARGTERYQKHGTVSYAARHASGIFVPNLVLKLASYHFKV